VGKSWEEGLDFNDCNKIDFKLNLILNIQKPKSRESCIDLYEDKLLEKSVKGDYKIIYKDYSSV